jgi:radial spoke head protein 4A
MQLLTIERLKLVGDPWAQLPDILPHHISQARKIRKFFTGYLGTSIVSYPPFPGTEAHYLRAQISRITSSTVVCPLGYYTFDGEAADEDNPENNTNIIINTEFEVLPNEALLTLENWVHQIPFILPQGRVSWISPEKVKEESDNPDEENPDEENPDEDDSGDATGGDSNHEIEPESGPALLTSLTEDVELGGFPAWSTRPCSRLQSPKFSPIHLRSNRWPGAHAIYFNGKFACIYTGDGQKHLGGARFALPKLPTLQLEFKGDLAEQIDPSVDDEKKFEESLKEKEDDAQPDEASDDDGDKDA